MHKKYFLRQKMAVCGLFMASTGAVWAQVAPPGAELEEIVVTAEKRESTVQKTPISISVFTGAELQAKGLSDLTAVAQETPGVSFKTSGPGQTEFEMRGLTSTGGESPTVGFYLDETALTPPAMAQNGKVVIDPSLLRSEPGRDSARPAGHAVWLRIHGRNDQARHQPTGHEKFLCRR